IHASGSWADETEKDIVRHQNKYQPSQLDAILTQINNVSQQLADIHNNLAFTLTRVKIVSSTSKTPIKNVSFQYDHMSTDDWSAFSHKSDTLFTSCQLVTLDKHKLKSKQALNFYWDLI
ncbi:7422_t:CDS:2, partial [Funneliformis geosporum]